MPKERSINPAQAQRKADKQKEIAKSRKLQQGQRNEKLARRNPERLQRQIDDLKDLEARGTLRPKDKETLAQLERDAKGVRRAREALGDAAPKFREGRPGGESSGVGRDVREQQRERREQQHLGKRRRDQDEADGSDTDPEVRSIPMPRDTPPPLPSQPRERFVDPQVQADGQRIPHGLPSRPVPAAPAAQTVYSSAPQIRDLKKEAVRFMPSVVAQQQNRVKGVGKLLEPDEMDVLEKSGYGGVRKTESAEVRVEKGVVEPVGKGGVDLDEEARRFEEELRGMGDGGGAKGVGIEEVEDDGT